MYLFWLTKENKVNTWLSDKEKGYFFCASQNLEREGNFSKKEETKGKKKEKKKVDLVEIKEDA